MSFSFPPPYRRRDDASSAGSTDSSAVTRLSMSTTQKCLGLDKTISKDTPVNKLRGVGPVYEETIGRKLFPNGGAPAVVTVGDMMRHLGDRFCRSVVRRQTDEREEAVKVELDKAGLLIVRSDAIPEYVAAVTAAIERTYNTFDDCPYATELQRVEEEKSTVDEELTLELQKYKSELKKVKRQNQQLTETVRQLSAEVTKLMKPAEPKPAEPAETKPPEKPMQLVEILEMVINGAGLVMAAVIAALFAMYLWYMAGDIALQGFAWMAARYQYVLLAGAAYWFRRKLLMFFIVFTVLMALYFPDQVKDTAMSAAAYIAVTAKTSALSAGQYVFDQTVKRLSFV